jgi:hypothetical protein
MAPATAQPQVASIKSERKSAALEVYLKMAHATAADKPMGTDDAESLYDAMERLDFQPELFESDVECLRSLKLQTIAQFDHTKTDAERAELHKFLKARADKRERERLNPPAARHKNIPLTTESCGLIQRDNAKRIAQCDEILKMLRQELGINTGGRIVGPTANQMADLAFRASEAGGFASILREFESCNPRLFAGAVDDKRDAWDFATVQTKRTENRRSGANVELSSRTEIEERLLWRGNNV